MSEYTTLGLGEEEITSTLATGEEEPVTGLTTFALGEETLPTQQLGEDGPSTKMYGEEGEFVPDPIKDANPFGSF